MMLFSFLINIKAQLKTIQITLEKFAKIPAMLFRLIFKRLFKTVLVYIKIQRQ